jgi:hypothetical protein
MKGEELRVKRITKVIFQELPPLSHDENINALTSKLAEQFARGA